MSTITTNYFRDEPTEDIFDGVRFGGSWQNDDEVKLFDMMRWVDDLDKPSCPGSYKTNEDEEISKFYRMLEDAGVNTIELRRNISGGTDDEVYRMKKQAVLKENRRIERKLISKIEMLNNNPKFKRLVEKSEKAANNYRSEEKLEGDLDYRMN